MIKAEALRVIRAGRALVDDANLELRSGRFTIIIGPNGAGKSTLLKALSGELAPTSGAVMFHGRQVAGLSPRELARHRAVLPQATALAFPFTALEIVAMGATAHGSCDVRESARRALAKVDLAGFENRTYPELSGGEQQRVQFARVLAQLPYAVIDGQACTMLLDEPTASLDIGHQIALLENAAAFARDGGAVLAILHDLNLAAEFADELVVMHKGRIVASGTPAETLTDAVVTRVYGIRGAVGRTPDSSVPFILPQAREGRLAARA